VLVELDPAGTPPEKSWLQPLETRLAKPDEEADEE
jgi:hypothetical protein